MRLHHLFEPDDTLVVTNRRTLPHPYWSRSGLDDQRALEYAAVYYDYYDARASISGLLTGLVRPSIIISAIGHSTRISDAH